MQSKPNPLTVIIDPPGTQSGMPGDTLELYIVISNQSNQGAVIDVFFDEASETLNQWSRSRRERLALAPEQSSELTFQFDIPVDALPGTYDYTLVVDAPEHFPEDTPIQFPRQLKVMLREHTAIRVKDPTFSLQPTTNPNNPAIIKPGQTLQVEVKVNNRSDRVDRFHITCPDSEEDWFTIRYVPTGFEGAGAGLLLGSSGLELNPGSQGQIWLQFHPPAGTFAGSYSPTIRLHSANFPDLVLLDLVYIQIPATYRLDVELNTIRGKVSRSSGHYEIKLTNQGSTPRELEVGINSQDEEQLYTYQCDPRNVRLLPNKSFQVNLTVKPRHWWRRPLIGAGLTFNFTVELQDKENLPLPENLPRGVLVWNSRPWWQTLLLVLAVIGFLGGLAFLIWLNFIKPPAPPNVASFTPDSPNYTEGDKVLLNWQISNFPQLSTLNLKIDGSVASAPQDFHFHQNQDIPDRLKNLCQRQKETDTLTCTNYNTGVTQPGDYTFTLSAFPLKQDKVSSSRTLKVKVNEKPAPKVVGFKPNQNQYTTGNEMLLSWKIQNPDDLSQLQIIGKTEGTQTVLETYTRDQFIPSSSQPKSPRLPTQQSPSKGTTQKGGLSIAGINNLCKLSANQVLTCTNVPVKTPQPGKYTFELLASKPNKPPSSLSAPATIDILPKPLKIVYFTLNGSQEPTKVLQKGETVTLSWKVEGDDMNVELSPFGKVDPSGSRKLKADEALPPTIELIVTDKFNRKDSRGFFTKVNVPTPPPSPQSPSPRPPSPQSPFPRPLSSQSPFPRPLSSQSPFPRPPVRLLPAQPNNSRF